MRIARSPVLFLLFIAAVTTACHRSTGVPASSVVKLTVTPRWGDAPFNRNEVYDNGAGQRVLVQSLRFYLSDLRLVGGGATDTLFRADLFDVTDGPVSRVIQMPQGTSAYNEVRMGLGLPPDLNATDISQVPVNDPLGNNSGMYWTWATMYRFFLLDGRFDNDLGAIGPLPFQFSLHTGLDPLFRPMAFPFTPEVVQDTLRLDLVLGVDRIFQHNGEVLDLSQGSQWHGTVGDIAIGAHVADMESNAFLIE